MHHAILGLSLGFSKFLVLPLPVTVIHLSSLFSPSFVVPAHRHLLPESSFSAYPPKSAINLMRGLKSTLCSLQIDLKQYPLYFLFHMHLSGSTQWDFLRWYFFQWGYVFFFGLLSLSFAFFFLPRDLGFLVFLCSRLQYLCHSSDEPLSELAPYVDLVYSESVSPFIIVLRNDTESATECAVPAFGAGAFFRALTPPAPASSVKIVWSDVALCT